jgi:hypothetical protein
MKWPSPRTVLPDIAIMLLVVITYIPVWNAGFIWDDDHHLTQNVNIVGDGGLGGIWTSRAATYYPLVLTSFWIQHARWGLSPQPYHLVLMHALCAILLRRVLLKLNAPPVGAWLAGVIWALHPVQTESAAWITELKNTQSGMFYLLAILLFLEWRIHKRRLLYLSFLLSGVFALLSKTSTVMLPVVVLLCAWWLDGRWTWSTLRAISPFFLLSAAAGVWTIWEQKFHSGAMGGEWAQNVPERIAVAGDCIWFYLGNWARARSQGEYRRGTGGVQGSRASRSESDSAEVEIRYSFAFVGSVSGSGIAVRCSRTNLAGSARRAQVPGNDVDRFASRRRSNTVQLAEVVRLNPNDEETRQKLAELKNTK